jgi:hypothetical protein
MIAVAVGQDQVVIGLLVSLPTSSTTPLPAGKVVFASTTMTPFWPIMMLDAAPALHHVEVVLDLLHRERRIRRLRERDSGEAGCSCGNCKPQSAILAKHGINIPLRGGARL